MLIHVKVFDSNFSEENSEACEKYKKKLKKRLINHKSHSHNGNIIHVVTHH